MNAANAMLARDPRATLCDPNQAYELALAQVLGAANANGDFVRQACFQHQVSASLASSST
jgi:hypothetical protein